MSIWWMYDNRKFKQLSDDPNIAYCEAIKCWESDPWGSLGAKGSHGNGIIIQGFGSENRCEFINSLDEWLETTTNTTRR